MKSRLLYILGDEPSEDFIEICKVELGVDSFCPTQIVASENKIIRHLKIIGILLFFRIRGYRCFFFQSRHAFKRIWSVDILRLALRVCLMRTYVDRRMAERRIAPSIFFLKTNACQKTLQEGGETRHRTIVTKYPVSRVPAYNGTPTRDICYISQTTENFLRGYYWDHSSPLGLSKS